MKWSELISPQAKEFNMRAMERVYRERQEGKEIYPPDNLIYRAIELTPPDAVKVCGDLTAWAERGVLLLNTTLTVYAHQPNSHAKWEWKDFTGEILRAASRLPQPVVFMLWGNNAQDFLLDLKSPAAVKEGSIIREPSAKKAFILSSHPSPFSASRPCRGTQPFKGSRPFSTANNLLIEMGGEPIEWKI